LDRPILLYVGADDCRWCGVMDREVYGDPGLGAMIDSLFVPVRVDRDERPDVADRYAAAVRLLAGLGGYPITAFLTPDGSAFFGGTYFPLDDPVTGRGLRQLLPEVAKTYREQRASVVQRAALVRQLSLSRGGFPHGVLQPAAVRLQIEAVRAALGPAVGGRGGPDRGSRGFRGSRGLRHRRELGRGARGGRFGGGDARAGRARHPAQAGVCPGARGAARRGRRRPRAPPAPGPDAGGVGLPRRLRRIALEPTLPRDRRGPRRRVGARLQRFHGGRLLRRRRIRSRRARAGGPRQAGAGRAPPRGQRVAGPGPAAPRRGDAGRALPAARRSDA